MLWKNAVASSFVIPVISIWFLSGWYVRARLRYLCLSSRSDAPLGSPKMSKDFKRMSFPSLKNRGGEGGGEGGTSSAEGGGVEFLGGEDGGGGDGGTKSS